MTMATDGFLGFYIETRNYGATASFWKSLGFQNQFETDHGSGQWIHPKGGPYVFIAENGDEAQPLMTHPILAVEDSAAFNPTRPVDYLREFEPQHWGVVEALLRDPDGREVSLQAPLPPGTTAPNLDDHHEQKYG
jgi:hypothetical protein